MSPNINDILGSPDLAAEAADTDFDLDKFLSETDNIIASKTAEQRSDQPAPEGASDPEGAPTPPVEAVGGEAAGGEPEGVGVDTPPPEAVPPSAPDPLAELSPERRAQLIALDRYMSEHPDALTRITEPPPPPAPEPITLPEHIDPGSVEAELWTKQEEQRRLLEEIKAGQDRTQQEMATERLRQVSQTAAQTAGANFAARYTGKLTQDDVLAIAQLAGQGIAGRLAAQATTPEEITAAYDEALEHVLWRTEDFRTKVTGPVVTEPTPKQKDAAAAPERKRKLTALSGAASPAAGVSPTRSPLQTREDGRLTGQSRMDLVKSLAAQLRGGSEGT
jgi:hypothetical protein